MQIYFFLMLTKMAMFWDHSNNQNSCFCFKTINLKCRESAEQVQPKFVLLLIKFIVLRGKETGSEELFIIYVFGWNIASWWIALNFIVIFVYTQKIISWYAKQVQPSSDAKYIDFSHRPENYDFDKQYRFRV